MKSRRTAAILAFTGALAPPIPIAGWHVTGLHKFYVGQPIWGILYLLLSMTHIPRIASLIEGIWYLVQSEDEFNRNFNSDVDLVTVTVEKQVDEVQPEQVGAIADAVRQLDRLRQEGLITEYEFEQKRRQLLDRIA